ncbi:MAG: DUF4129 domain-containing protein [Muribaculaceae bacterium]|nr:DUF4129 domain-containing protein [Muribaculaceae bacterium]
MPASTSHIIDTLQCDTTLLQRLQQSSSYEYNREFVQQDTSVIDRILRWLESLFSTSVDKATEGDMSIFWVIGGIIVVIAAGVYLYTHDVGLFRRSGKSDIDYEAEDEDIYGIDFDDRINQAVTQHDWREATRLTYLKTLRWLADNNRIDWALFKTPSQYTREERSPEFRDMTNEFLRVRYGNFDANEATYNEMQGRSRTLIARISDELVTQQTQEGGDA